ncbi:MAG: hypothetical protein ACLPX5_09630 [Dissulfurispiraceae bacterium]
MLTSIIGSCRSKKLLTSPACISSISGMTGLIGAVLDKKNHCRGLACGAALGAALGYAVVGLAHILNKDDPKDIKYFSELSSLYTPADEPDFM